MEVSCGAVAPPIEAYSPAVSIIPSALVLGSLFADHFVAHQAVSDFLFAREQKVMGTSKTLSTVYRTIASHLIKQANLARATVPQVPRP